MKICLPVVYPPDHRGKLKYYQAAAVSCGMLSHAKHTREQVDTDMKRSTRALFFLSVQCKCLESQLLRLSYTAVMRWVHNHTWSPKTNTHATSLCFITGSGLHGVAWRTLTLTFTHAHKPRAWVPSPRTAHWQNKQHWSLSLSLQGWLKHTPDFHADTTINVLTTWQTDICSNEHTAERRALCCAWYWYYL